MNHIKRLALGIGFLLWAYNLQAQTYVTPTQLSGTAIAPGQYYNYSSIQLGPGTTITPGTGQSVKLYTADPDCQPLNAALSSNQNYILTSVPRTPIATTAGLQNRTTCELMQTVQYFDGLGRPLQTVQVKGSTEGKDVVQLVAYDQFGRETQKYLPYAAQGTADGSYKSSATTDQTSFYNTPPLTSGVSRVDYPWAGTDFEPSPLNRIVEQGAPGIPWQLSTSGVSGSGHTLKMTYGLNEPTDVPLWIINSTGNGLTGGNTYYGAGQLYVTTTTDENEHNAIEYKDKDGHVVCKRVQGPAGYLATQYVYDDLGNLAYVLPPPPVGTTYPASVPETDAIFTGYVYGYHYDERNRLVEKKLPGKDWEFMVYNTLDQMIATQDGVQRAKTTQEWTFIKYDQFGRVAYTGIYQYPGSTAGTSYRSALQTTVNGQTKLWESQQSTGTGYPGDAWPQTGVLATLTVNYYDDYSFPANPYTAAALGTITNPTGLLTATKTTILNADGTYGPMLWTVHRYDAKGREQQTFKQHYLGGVGSSYNYDEINNTYDNITSELTDSKREHYTKNAGNTDKVKGVTVLNTYVYDHMGRKVQAKEQIDNNPQVVLSQTDYNEIGQVEVKHLHAPNGTTAFLQDINYTYNERGWLSKINDPSVALTSKQLFAEQLNYNQAPTGVLPQFNGNITEQIYNAGISGKQNVKYSYDALNRLTDGISSATFSEKSIQYDNLGNIKKLTRGTNPEYSYNYTGNQLQTVTELTGSTYTYDPNGNMKHDGRNNRDVYYNVLNLPRSVTGASAISYVYDAAGEKLRKVSGTTVTDYIGGIQYTTTGAGAPLIDFIQTEEGRANKSGTNYVYEYTLTDHLGNNRVTFDETSGKVGEDDYYPFGMYIHRQINAGNKYLYNKKELQEELNQYDYGARFYDPVIARWARIDPKAELYSNWSPYTYALNTPINAIDPNGHLVIFINGNQYGVTGIDYWQSKKDVTTTNIVGFDGQMWSQTITSSVVDQDFAGAVMAQLHDGNSLFINGAGSYIKGYQPFTALLSPGFSGIGSGDRQAAGKRDGRSQAPSIIHSLHRSGGVLESIKIITHSMGGAYGKGFVAGLKEYIKTLPAKMQKEILISLVADFDPLDGGDLIVDPSIKTMQFMHKANHWYNNILGYGWLANQVEQGMDPANLFINTGTSTDHNIMTFFNEIINLAPGDYVWDGKGWVPK